MANFSELPQELIELCIKPLMYFDDRIRFGAACKSWRSAYLATRDRPSYCSPPWLMITNDADDTEDCRTFACLSGECVIDVPVPGIRGRKCWGSPFGWVVTFGLDYSINILNPLSGVQIPLPHQSTFPIQFCEEILETRPGYVRLAAAERFILSSNPSLTNQDQPCFVMAISNPGRNLIFAKLGDVAWTLAKTSYDCYFDDAIYFNGQAYAFDHAKGCLCVFDINTPQPIGKIIESPPPPTLRRRREDSTYLVEMYGELLLLVRFYDDDNHKFYSTKHFYVYKFHFSTKSWVEVSDLGDHAIFVGNTSPFIISTEEYPDFNRNSIYYTDGHYGNLTALDCDMAFYDYEKKTSKPFYICDDELSAFSRPTFIIPKL